MAAVSAAAAAGNPAFAPVREREREEVGTGMYNDGLKDVGAVPNRVLIVRGLDTLTTEELVG
jgi:hypothetical protein